MKKKDYEKGQIASFYTLNGWFCTIKPAYKIDKVQFDFVKKGTNAKSAFSIYVDMDRFDLLCDDILSGRFSAALEADKGGTNPQAWKYVTGEKASKELRIGAGRNTPVVIQGVDKKTQGAYASVGIMGYDDLRILAKDFRRTSAAAFNERAQRCLEEAGKYRRYYEEDDGEEVPY